MNDTFSVFRRFSIIEQAKELEVLLSKNQIETKIADNIASLDSSFSGSTLQNQFEIQIQLSDFEKAAKILDENAENLIEQIDKNHYLFDFTDDELYEVILKSDEWNILDYKLAQKILIKRGKSIDEELLEGLKKQRLELLKQPEGSQKPWVIAGYIFVILGGLLGIFIGYSLFTSKKSLPNGQQVFSYGENDRMHGKNIFYIGLIFLVFYVFLRIFTML